MARLTTSLDTLAATRHGAVSRTASRSMPWFHGRVRECCGRLGEMCKDNLSGWLSHNSCAVLSRGYGSRCVSGPVFPDRVQKKESAAPGPRSWNDIMLCHTHVLP